MCMIILLLIWSFHKAKSQNLFETTVLGTGTPRREFLFADDLAEVVVCLVENKDVKNIGEFINIGSSLICKYLMWYNLLKKQ